MDTRMWTRQILEYMKKYHMAETGDGILAAVSGGADSVCLLLVLEELSEDLGIHLAAFHLNHGLRGTEADRDEAYVRELCASHGIPLKVVHEQVRDYAAGHGMSEEEAGRVLRYQHLEAAAKEFDCQWIATAHHKSDNVETVLMNLFRGSGFRGIGGIRPVRGNIIRPLLQVSRQEVENYLNKKKVGWCEDSTNQETEYGRNKLRNQLLPWLREQVNEQVDAHILKTAEFACQADEYFSSLAETLLEDGECRISTEVFDAQPEIVKSYLLRAMIRRCSGSEKDISARHLNAICALTGPGGGTSVALPCGLCAVRGYDMLEILSESDEENGKKTEKEEICVEPGQTCYLEKMGYFVEIRTFSLENKMEIPKKQCTKWFDYDKIKGTLYIRTREAGDYYLIGDGKKKRLKRFFIDEKIPEAVRGTIPLLAEGNHVLWIFGYRISEHYKLSDSTRTVLEVRIHKGETCDGKN